MAKTLYQFSKVRFKLALSTGVHSLRPKAEGRLVPCLSHKSIVDHGLIEGIFILLYHVTW